MGKKLFTIALCLFISIGAAWAQTIRVSGTVTDVANGEPVVGAAVQLKGSASTYALTDVSGKYTLSVPADAILTVSSLGFNPAEVQVNGRGVVDIGLTPEAQLLDDVLVVAYGTAKKESFTGSAGTVKSESLQKRTVANVSKALEGMVAGISTTSGSGQPGEGASIQIRGTGSINASSNPLYVVDGIPFDGNLSSINPNDIESLTVLKDASAAALYGARAANGVIMITTKRGSEGHSVVNFKATVGLQSRSIRDYDTVNQEEFVELTWEALKNNYVINGGYDLAKAKTLASAGLSGALGGEFYNPFKNYKWADLIDPETGRVRSDAVSAWDDNWMDVLTEDKAVRQEYQLGVSGGTHKTKYAFSLGYLDDKGVLITTKFKRYSLRANVDHSVNDWMKLGASASYAYTNQNSSQYSDTQTGNAWYTAQFMAPIYPVYLKDDSGANLLDEFGNKQYDYGENGRPKAANFNVVGDLYDNSNEILRDNSGVRAYAIIGGDSDAMGIFKGLSFSTNFGADITNMNRTSYYNPYHGDGKSQGGSVDKFSTRTFSYTWNQILKYERNLNDFHFLGQLGHEYYNYHTSTSQLTAQVSILESRNSTRQPT